MDYFRKWQYTIFVREGLFVICPSISRGSALYYAGNARDTYRYDDADDSALMVTFPHWWFSRNFLPVEFSVTLKAQIAKGLFILPPDCTCPADFYLPNNNFF